MAEVGLSSPNLWLVLRAPWASKRETENAKDSGGPVSEVGQ